MKCNIRTKTNYYTYRRMRHYGVDVVY